MKYLKKLFNNSKFKNISIPQNKNKKENISEILNLLRGLKWHFVFP